MYLPPKALQVIMIHKKPSNINVPLFCAQMVLRPWILSENLNEAHVMKVQIR